MTKVSVIIPVFNEAANLAVLHERLSGMAAAVRDCRFEFLFVDDGSSDETPAILSRMREIDERVKVIRFSRNFGSHAACLAGLIEAQGDYIGFLAADLQDPPGLIPEMLGKMQEGFDVVFAVRNQREDPWLTIMLASAYHRLMRRYAIPTWPVRGADVFMISRAVRDVIARWRQKNTSVFAQILWVGFRQASLSYNRQQRYSGCSKWSLAKKMKLLADSFVSFSFTPIRLISYAGAGLGTAGFGYAAFIIFNKLVNGAPVLGWASLMVVLLLVSGFQLLTLGVIGEYLWRVADEVRGTPPFVVESRLGIDGARAGDPCCAREERAVEPIKQRGIASLEEYKTL